MAKVDDDTFAQALANELHEAEETEPKPVVGGGNTWYPDLNLTQKEIFEDPAEVVIGVGPKGSGKSIGFGHKIIRHSYEEQNALTTMLSPMQTTGFEGIGYDMEQLILPQWKDGINLHYKSWKMDPVTKDRHMWIGNRFFGYSKIVLKSIPHASMVEDRIKGPAPSMFYVDELTNCRGDEYFKFPNAQQGRRRGIIGPQQYLASCNPEGPDHWVYKLLYEDYVVKHGGKVWPNDPEKPGIMRDPSLSCYFVPFHENAHRLPAGYRERLERMFRSDPVLYDRLINGRWLEYPSGEALFKLYFNENNHFIGDSKLKKGITPTAGIPIVVGYDLGKVNSGIVFMQCIETQFGPYWVVFDELCYVGEKIPYPKLARALLAKMAYWNRRMNYKFQFRHISDNSAFNQFQAAKGSTDARDIAEYTAKLIVDNPEVFAGLETVRMKECPKPANSISDRVSIMMDALSDEQIIVSATCATVKRMFLNLERAKEDPMEPSKTSTFRHVFDAMTYPMYHRKYVATSGYSESSKTSVELA